MRNNRSQHRISESTPPRICEQCRRPGIRTITIVARATSEDHVPAHSNGRPLCTKRNTLSATQHRGKCPRSRIYFVSIQVRGSACSYNPRINEGVIPRQSDGRTKTYDPLDRRCKQCFLCPIPVSIPPEDVGGAGIGSIAVGFDGTNESNRTENRYRSSEFVSSRMNRWRQLLLLRPRTVYLIVEDISRSTIKTIRIRLVDAHNRKVSIQRYGITKLIQNRAIGGRQHRFLRPIPVQISTKNIGGTIAFVGLSGRHDQGVARNRDRLSERINGSNRSS